MILTEQILYGLTGVFIFIVIPGQLLYKYIRRKK